ncbi:MAG: hypothetical protein WDM71_05290 [Ferruginibacter sp.]
MHSALALIFFADNAVDEIYVNDIPQSPYLGGSIPPLDPYYYTGYYISGKTSVSLCRDWQPGANTLIIHIATGAPYEAFLAQGSIEPVLPITDTVNASICQGQNYNFGGINFDSTGLYYQDLKTSTGCDSPVVLNLTVGHPSSSTLDTSICFGKNYLGHTTSGTYTDTLNAVNGCDSFQIVTLTVEPPITCDYKRFYLFRISVLWLFSNGNLC